MKINDKVYAAGIGMLGVIIAEDINNQHSPKLDDEKLWIVKWDNGRIGGGWRSGELIVRNKK